MSGMHGKRGLRGCGRRPSLQVMRYAWAEHSLDDTASQEGGRELWETKLMEGVLLRRPRALVAGVYIKIGSHCEERKFMRSYSSLRASILVLLCHSHDRVSVRNKPGDLGL